MSNVQFYIRISLMRIHHEGLILQHFSSNSHFLALANLPSLLTRDLRKKERNKRDRRKKREEKNGEERKGEGRGREKEGKI